MDLDDVADVRDFSRATFEMLAQRAERSTTEAHLVYRETELDELWRLLDLSIRTVNAQEAAALTQLRGIVMTAHDLVGVDGNLREAARTLREGALQAPLSA